MTILKDIVYGTQDPTSQILDIYLPDCEEADLVIFFHGGGLERGDKGSNPCFKPLVERGKALISANYRMYPNAKFPEFIEDAAAVVNWAMENMPAHKKIRKIFVSGSSAGAYLTAMLAFAPDYLGKYNIKTTDITGYIIDSGQMTTHFNVLRERGLDTRRIVVDEAAPVSFIDENTQFPNIYIFVADNDMPCRLEQNLMFIKTLEMFHCPPERISYQLMEGFRHTGYDYTEEYINMVDTYINTTN